MYEVSCRDLGMADCDFYLLAYSLERLELDLLAHARCIHPGLCAAVDAEPGSHERRALRARIIAVTRVVPSEPLVV